MLFATSSDRGSSSEISSRLEHIDSDSASLPLIDSEKSSSLKSLATPSVGSSLQDCSRVSPALAGSSTVANAYELKCVFSERTAQQLKTFFGNTLQVDAYASSVPLGQYRITTLSTDTVDLDCFHRVAGYARRKYRLRRYGDEEIVYLERKTRRGNRVEKIRSAIPAMELIRLERGVENSSCDSPISTHALSEWAGNDFQSQLERRSLLPTCLMSYQRQAWFGQSENGAIRLTMDRNLRGRLTSSWMMDSSDSSDFKSIISDDAVVCEFKFRGSLPAIFKAAIQEFSLDPGGFSKYRNCMSVLMGRSEVVCYSQKSGAGPCQNG